MNKEKMTAEEYSKYLEECLAKKEEIQRRNDERNIEKIKKQKAETKRLLKIFTPERCGEKNMHFVKSLIERASFYRSELEFLEQDIRELGSVDLFIQGTQCLLRESPSSKIHVAYSKNYKDIISKLEAYEKLNANPEKVQTTEGTGLMALLNKGENARSKYKK